MLRVSDCNLDEEEIVKLATVGRENNAQDAIDVLKKSLVIRNKYVISIDVLLFCIIC